MSLFKNLNFPRGVILVTTLTSLLLGWFVWTKMQRLESVRVEIGKAPGEIKKIQELAFTLDELLSKAEKEGFKGVESAETYIRKIAQIPNVNVGQLEINPDENIPFTGVKDLVYRIKPANKTQRFGRTNIANFLYSLEEKSRRVKVTSLKLTPITKIAPGSVGDDFWTFEAEITSRSLEEMAGS